MQIGKYNGEFPFVVEVSGVYKSEPFSESFIISNEDVFEADSLHEEAWAGNYINYLETLTQTNNVIDEIVYQSVSERVLSRYSAFLCLEPSRGGEVCYDCLDEGEIIGVVEGTLSADEETEVLTAYPNPFNSQVNIKLTLPSSLISENISIKIYNILGEEIKSYYFEPIQNAKSYDFIWDGRNDDGVSVASGIYFFMVHTPQKNFSVKLLLMK